ncbi:MAG: outer membrane protein assembly factor BamA [Paludibacter sp.]|nr:outer membrane protein assembly factor BamA [Paludibacter sp.]
MFRKICFTFLTTIFLICSAQGQSVVFGNSDIENNNSQMPQVASLPNDTVYNPDIAYNAPAKQYTISGITVSGAPNFDEFAVIGYSGLDIGRTITIPGTEITTAVKRFVRQGLFSDVKIAATKIYDNRIWLEIRLKERPRVSELNFSGVKKSEKEDLEKSIGILKDNQITPNITNRAEQIVKKHLAAKGFSDADVKIYQKDDPEKSGYVIVDVAVDKKEKIKVNKIIVTGNTVLNQMKIDNAMKKTNEKGKWYNFFRSKKFLPDEFDKDKNLLVERYNNAGYRDAYIVADSVVHVDGKLVNVYITVDEGKKYYFGNLNWVGNTIYPTEYLSQILNIQKGEVYNHKLLNDRLQVNDDAVSKLYNDRGYLFAHIEPVEVSIDGDSINFEMRIYEGRQATINNVGITGNDRVYEHVIRRELYTKPGQLYSQSDIIRSLGEIARMGLFDPESVYKNIEVLPDPENGTVDINYGLTTKSSDQVEFSAGWGGTGFVGSVGLKFTNFAIQNIFTPKMYKIVPQGEGQTFSLNFRSSGLAYNSASISFVEPWFGGKRPNSLSVSFYWARQNSYSNRFLNNSYSSYYNPYNSMNGYNIYGNNYNYGSSEFDPGKFIQTIVGSIGYGKRLKWPDDYFTFYGELSYQLYTMHDWPYMGLYDENNKSVTEGVFHNPAIGLTISRNSVMNPIYPRSGSTFSLSLKITPPYSLLNGKDYTKIPFAERYRFIEYHKWKFSAKTFTPLDNREKFVLMTRAEFGYLGHFNKNARSPFEVFMLGGDGMSAYSGAYTMGMEYIPLRGYDAGAPYVVPRNATSSATSASSYVYNKFTVEVRYPIILGQNNTTIWALGFVEAGNSFFNMKDYNPFNLARSAGAGVRIFLPMFGLLGIDWAYGFDRTPGATKVSGSHFHFVLGQEL